MRARTSLLFALLLAPGVLAAQGTAYDSAHARQAKDTLASIRKRTTSPTIRRQVDWLVARENALMVKPVPPAVVARVGIIASASSIPVSATLQLYAQAFDASNTPITTPIAWSASPSTVATISGAGLLTGKGAGSVTVTARADSVTNSRVYAVTAPIPIPPDTTTPPTPDSTAIPLVRAHPFAPPANGALLAEFPRDTVDATYPTIARRYSCTNLQVCLDTAKTGDEIRLAKGASFTDPVVRPTARALWTVVRTDVTDVELGGPWERMTVSKANALNLATIRSSGGSVSALSVASSAHHVRFVGVRFTTGTLTTSIVRIGFGESDPAQLPHHITLDRVVVDPGALGDVRRCVTLDGAYLAVLSSTLANCHSNRGDSQGAHWYNANGPLRVENNTIQAGHQSVFSGGGDPAIRGQVPADIVVRRNDLSRPLAWKGVWQTKTNVELKIGKRVLIEGNVICHTWPDAQSGFAVLLKTENQDGGTWGDWSETSDVTVRYNRICGAGGGFNLAGLAQGPGVAMARVSAYANEGDSIGVAPYKGDTGDALLVQGVSDVVFRDNWTRNPEGRSAIYMTDPNARFVATGNTFGGQYGIRGEGGLAVTAPGSIISGNVQLPWLTPFGSWPAIPSSAIRDALLAGVQVTP